MPFSLSTVKLDKSAGRAHRALQYAFYDWTREMPRSKRIIKYVAVAFQGYAVYVMLIWAFMVQQWLYSFLVLPRRPVSYVLVFLIYYTGYYIQNGMRVASILERSALSTNGLSYVRRH